MLLTLPRESDQKPRDPDSGVKTRLVKSDSNGIIFSVMTNQFTLCLGFKYWGTPAVVYSHSFQ